MKKSIIIMMAITGFSFADTYNCDSNCLNGSNMMETNNTVTGTQATTSNAFAYFTGTTCNGVNLMNNFSNGTQTIKQVNSTTCGYTVASSFLGDFSGGCGGTNQPICAQDLANMSQSSIDAGVSAGYLAVDSGGTVYSNWTDYISNLP